MLHYSASGAKPAREERRLLAEAPLAIELRGGPAYTIMRTPPHEGAPATDRELAVGFLLAEGLIRSADDIHVLEECAGGANCIRATLAGEPPPEVGRTLAVSASCGLCGRTDVETLVANLAPVAGRFEAPVDVLYALPERVHAGQALFAATGASHAAALFRADGEILILREDIGRHNALDKVVGHALLAGMDLSAAGVFLSGRVSLEMVVKTVRAGVPLIAAVSAASAAAVEAAERLGLTLCGFARGSEVTVYTHDERVKGAG